MTLPVSSYEELLARVRNLTHETLQLRRELSKSLNDPPVLSNHFGEVSRPLNAPSHAIYPEPNTSALQNKTTGKQLLQELFVSDFENLTLSDAPTSKTGFFDNFKSKEQNIRDGNLEERPTTANAFRSGGEWGSESLGLWHSGPSSLTFSKSSPAQTLQESENAASMSTISVGGPPDDPELPRRAYSYQQLGAKVEMVYNLLSMLGATDKDEMSMTLLAMSSSIDSCQAMRQSGCLPLLIQLIHSSELDVVVRSRASEALQNIVHAQSDDKRRRREIRVLKFLQTVREHCDTLKTELGQVPSQQHPGQAVAALMKYSFDADHRQAICTLGGLQALAELIEIEEHAHGSTTEDVECMKMRRYSGMALTNLTFGDGTNKALLCSLERFMCSLIAQLNSPSDELRQVTASLIRNLSWRADPASKSKLRECQTVSALTLAAMRSSHNEPTLKSILSALWNLSAHSAMNKVDICSVPGALAFLVRTLKYKSTNTLGVIENAGGILRNISSHIAVNEDFRQILREENCFDVLLEQLKSPSLTVVSNACGTLWNLSARCPEDQQKLWDMGASTMLRSLVQSKHKMIAMGASAALKNLIAANPNGNMLTHLDSTAREFGLTNATALIERKQRALVQELDRNLTETCENDDSAAALPLSTPKRSDSHESVTSTHSDSVYERLARRASNSKPKLLEKKDLTLHDSLSETGENSGRKITEARLLRRYKTSMIPQPASRATNFPCKTETQEGSQHSQINANKTRKPRGIPVLKSKPKLQSNSKNQNFQGTSCSSTTYAEEYETETAECPVNYSLQYPESEEMNKAKSESKNELEPMDGEYYAETDLDQPTDFSLKYGEDNENSDEQRLRYFDNSKEEDTTRTYYTEGTPYEGTPYTFSSANSVSDLRIVPCEKNNELKSEEQQGAIELIEQSKEELTGVETTSVISESTNYSTTDVLSRQQFESGVSTPERPIQYCEEGTPAGCFSRFSSLSSLTGGKESTKISPEKPRESIEKDARTMECPKKLVTFTSVPETPLMFSRSSSIGSLTSCMMSQPDGEDGNSSIVSAFSRLTSGLVSPSELPDSPTQTVPPSVRSEPINTSALNVEQVENQKSVPPNVNSVFDDAIIRYKQEDTPIIFSSRTSLSGIVSDEISENNALLVDSYEDQKVPEMAEDDRDRLELSSVSEVDESILADCISIGMGSADPGVRCKKAQYSLDTPAEDVVQTYHTEDTPLHNSHVGSHSDLSLLTVPSGLVPDDASSHCSDSDIQLGLLNECIHSGMPKVNQTNGEIVRKTALKPAPTTRILKKRDEGRKTQCGASSDEVLTFATENSPCNFSIRSSLSDLTINSGIDGLKDIRNDRIAAISPICTTNNPGSPNTSPNSTANRVDVVDEEIHGNKTFESEDEENVTARSRHQSLSSLSMESFDSCEPTPLEQALLEQCIHSGMPHKVKSGSEASAIHNDEKLEGNIFKERRINKEQMINSVETHTWSDDVDLDGSIAESSNSANEPTGLHIIEEPVPNFHVGAPITTIQDDTAIICRELRRIQEMELLQSVTSEVSTTSFGPFLDSDLLESPHKQSEEHTLTFNLLRIKADPPSIPSLDLGQIPIDLDLENSMMSVASITSEVAESPTLEASDNEIGDCEITSMNLPLDNESSETKPKRRITPKERRRQAQDRYRTYTVDELKSKCLLEENKKSVEKDDHNKWSLSTEQRYELLVNANLVTRTLENAIVEEEVDKSIDTMTYVNEINHHYHDDRTLCHDSGPKVQGNVEHDNTPPSIRREGTFTKDETVGKGRQEIIQRIPKPTSMLKTPALSCKSVVSDVKSPPTSRQRPASASSVTKISNVNTNHKRHGSAGTTSGFSGQRQIASSLPELIQSTGNHSGIAKSNNQVHKPIQGKPKTPKKEVTSKIASLWRKVEENKKKQQHVRDDRVWIGGGSTSPLETLVVEHVEVVDLREGNEVRENIVVEREELLDLELNKIVQGNANAKPSSCGKGIADANMGFRLNKEKVTNDTRKLPARDTKPQQKTSDKKNIVSAIVPPFNYSPPAKKTGDSKSKEQPLQSQYQQVTTV